MRSRDIGRSSLIGSAHPVPRGIPTAESLTGPLTAGACPDGRHPPDTSTHGGGVIPADRAGILTLTTVSAGAHRSKWPIVATRPARVPAVPVVPGTPRVSSVRKGNDVAARERRHGHEAEALTSYE